MQARALGMKLGLESITIHNFKSYRGTHVIRGLDPKFTAIVGANGSGKSNIIDSILFVLGFRARRMRHSSLADLIYSGDGKEDMCFVELGFNKFRIRREAYLSGRARYLVDGEEVSSAVVMSLLSSEGVDMEHNRFLILQGEIENVAIMKPMNDGLLEYLEDVIGTSGYKEDIEKGESELLRISEEYEGKSTALKFYLKEFEHIERRREENLSMAQRKAECLWMDRDLQLLFSERSRRRLDGFVEERMGIEEGLKDLARKNKENGSRVELLERKGQRAREKTQEASERFLGARREYQRVERKNRAMEEERDRLLRGIEELSKEIEEARRTEDARKKMVSGYSEEIEQNMSEISKCNGLAERLRRELSDEQEKIDREALKIVEEIRIEEERMMKLLARKGEVAERHRDSESRLGILLSRKEEVLRKTEEVSGKLSRIDEGKIGVGRTEEVIESEIREIEKDLAQTRKEMGRRMQRAEEYKENEEKSSKESEILKSIRGVKGVYGRLSDLGGVESRYDRAFRVAGKGLSSIVVDTTCTAEECISVIKKLGLGRATFIILDRISEVPVLPRESVPYMYSLIRCGEEFRKCFYFALKDTLVCDGLEQAERLAFGKQRKRVVTLDGKLIEKSGVMSGGRGCGRIKSTEELERACSRMMELKRVKAEELEVVRALRERGDLLKIRERLGSELKDVCSEIEKMDKEVDRKEVEEIERELGDAKERVSSLRAVIESLTDVETRRKREELRSLGERIEMFERRNLELRVQISSWTEAGIQGKEQELERKRRDLEGILIEDVSGLRSRMVECECEYKESAENLKEVLKELADVKSALGNDYHMEIDLKNRLDGVCDKAEECGRQIKESRAKIMLLEGEAQKYVGICNVETREMSSLGEMKEEEIDKVMERISAAAARMRKEGLGEVDFDVFVDYEKSRGEYRKAKEEYEWFGLRLKETKEMLEGLKKRRLDEFMEGLREVSSNLKEIYKTITYGGNAELELVDHLDPFSEGVVLSVMPPKKSWKSVGNLSGGEKTLSSLALIFALHKYRPSPFYVMDEIDAALDYRNVSVVSNFIREMSETAQFLVISLRSDMFELSETLLGVYRTNNVSQSLVVSISKLGVK